MKQDQLLQGTRVVLLARLPGAALAMFESCRVVHRLCSRIIHGPVRERVDMYISGCACACLCLRSHACMRACVDGVCFRVANTRARRRVHSKLVIFGRVLQKQENSAASFEACET